MCEFFYNNGYHPRIDMTQSEELYGRGCRLPIEWFDATDVKHLRVDSVKDAQDTVRRIQAKILVA